LSTSLVEQHELFFGRDFREDLFAFDLFGSIGLIPFVPPCCRDAIESKFPLLRESSRIGCKCVINPGWLTITDSN